MLKASCRDHPYSTQKAKKLLKVFIYKKPDTFRNVEMLSVLAPLIIDNVIVNYER